MRADSTRAIEELALRDPKVVEMESQAIKLVEMIHGERRA